MTLNITIATEKCIYQCADYRTTDWGTNKPADSSANQKIQFVNRAKWHATVCFNGVASVNGMHVSTWMAERIADIGFDDPFDLLLEELLKAEAWLSTIPPPRDSRHTFTIGAFVGSIPIVVLVSNYEQLNGSCATSPSKQLSIHQQRPSRPKVFVSGSGRRDVSRDTRWRLANLASVAADPKRIFSKLAEVNQAVAQRKHSGVSGSCFTTFLRRTGEGAGTAHGIEIPSSGLVLPNPFSNQGLTSVLDKQFGRGRARLRQFASRRFDASDEYHEAQMRDNPNDSHTYLNYGAYLEDKKRNIDGAEKQYRRALELDENNVIAIGNLANVLARRLNKDGAYELYRKALSLSPGHENNSWNFALFLQKVSNDSKSAREIATGGIATNPHSTRLLVFRANLDQLERWGDLGLEDYKVARDKGADQKAVEPGYACALHISGAPIEECIAAYRTATAVCPDNAALRLNLAQLLFARGFEDEANSQLHRAMQLGLDDSGSMEAQFYLLAHSKIRPESVHSSLNTLVVKGVRLNWDMTPNVLFVRNHDSKKAAMLDDICSVLSSQENGITRIQRLEVIFRSSY